MRRLIYVNGVPLVDQNRRTRQMSLDQRRLNEYGVNVEEEDGDDSNEPYPLRENAV